MIFVTVGTHQQPFGRLLKALESLPADELVVQHGPGEPPPGVRRAVAYMPFEEILEQLEAADAVVTHAGVGSILCARRVGHVPIVVPRLHRYAEHVDDHQAELTRALEGRGAVVGVWQAGDLPRALSSLPPRREPSENAEGPLHSALRRALLS